MKTVTIHNAVLQFDVSSHAPTLVAAKEMVDHINDVLKHAFPDSQPAVTLVHDSVVRVRPIDLDSDEEPRTIHKGVL